MVGIGNTIIAIVFSVVLTIIVGGLGAILSLIPGIGVLFKYLTPIAIILWWLFIIIGCIVDYGFMAVLFGIGVLIIILICSGGPDFIIKIWRK